MLEVFPIGLNGMFFVFIPAKESLHFIAVSYESSKLKSCLDIW